MKVPCLVAGMITGADSVDDMDVLCHGGMPALFGGIRAPSYAGLVPAVLHLGNRCIGRVLLTLGG